MGDGLIVSINVQNALKLVNGAMVKPAGFVGLRRKLVYAEAGNGKLVGPLIGGVICDIHLRGP